MRSLPAGSYRRAHGPHERTDRPPAVTLAGYDHLLAAGRRLQWEADALDLRADAAAWADVPAPVAARIRRLVGGFYVAEVAVATHLEPFVGAVHGEAVRACLRLQQTDERRHARFFTRAAREVLCREATDDAQLHQWARDAAGPAIVTLFEGELPALAGRLAAGEAQIGEAVGLYHLILEAIVFAVGQAALLEDLEALGTLPGLRDGVQRVQADERWHVGLGVMCLQDAGAHVDVTAFLTGALEAWGPQIATPERVRHALAVHERRLTVMARG